MSINQFWSYKPIMICKLHMTDKNNKFQKMKVEDLNKAKIPVVKINKKLEEFKGKVLFPEKLEMANKMLENVKLPVEISK